MPDCYLNFKKNCQLNVQLRPAFSNVSRKSSAVVTRDFFCGGLYSVLNPQAIFNFFKSS